MVYFIHNVKPLQIKEDEEGEGEWRGSTGKYPWVAGACIAGQVGTLTKQGDYWGLWGNWLLLLHANQESLQYKEYQIVYYDIHPAIHSLSTEQQSQTGNWSSSESFLQILKLQTCLLEIGAYQFVIL